MYSEPSNGHAVSVATSTTVGFYGKLPSHGDFLSRRVPEDFIGSWDAWLQECMAAVRESLADQWINVFCSSPTWRFSCAAGACGPNAVAGVIAPSVDKVGRYYPLTIVAELPPEWTPLEAAGVLETFFDRAEALVVDTMAAEQVAFEEFDAAVQRLADDLAPLYQPRGLVLDPAAASLLADSEAGRWQLPIGSPSQLNVALGQVVSQRLSDLYAPLVLWWTSGSEIVEPSCLLTRGLPSADEFVAFMDGAWADRRWHAVGAHVELAAAPASDTLVDDPTPPRFRSAGATHPGLVRQTNQDSYLERTDVGLWVVADGVGGHQDGDVASRMVCDALADFVPDASFEQMIEGAGRRLHEVNEHLVRAGMRPVNPVVSGSTVVALMARGTRCAIVWAGDSRVYRWRGGRMEQLTRDHSVAELEGGEESHAITRAVGGEATLALDLFRDRVRTGDRFLLCSDGLTRVLWESEIEDWLGHPDIAAAAQGLIDATLHGGAPDNVTVVIVEAYPDVPAARPADA